MLRSLLAPNPSAMTLTGTRTWIIGTRRVVIIDPGPADATHLDSIEEEVAGAVVACILLTHLHGDHAAGAPPLAARLGADIRSIGQRTLVDGDRVETDAGDVVAVHTPGHTPDHASFMWPAERAVFCGDLMMGGLDTALVAPPDGHLGDYFDSLERLRALHPAVIHPAHGPSFEQPIEAIDAYVRHRMERLGQARDALRAGRQDAAAVARVMYGTTIPTELQSVAVGAALAYLEHLVRLGEAEEGNGEFYAVQRDSP